MKRALFLLLATACFLGGCGSYQLGEPGELAYSSVFVSPTRNLTDIPQIEGAVNQALRKAIEQDSRLSLSPSQASSAILELALIESKRETAAVLAEDVGRVRKFQLNVEVSVSLRESAGSANFIIEDRRFRITQDIFTDSGQINAEHQAVAEMAAKIAQQANEILVDVW